MHRPLHGLLAVLTVSAIVVSLACVDATHDEQVAALGPEDPGVPTGPTHRPGQPCLVCHGSSGPASQQFSVAGTVVAVRSQSAPAPGVTVQIEDINDSIFTATTNSAGNFYVPFDQWQPTYPTQMQVSRGALSQQMNTHVGRDGSCAGCHTEPEGPTSPGAVYLALTPSGLPEGGL
ncbi:MAG: hypothetical protein ACREJ3_17905 [Polyangiaceae bacterium]